MTERPAYRLGESFASRSGNTIVYLRSGGRCCHPSQQQDRLVVGGVRRGLPRHHAATCRHRATDRPVIVPTARQYVGSRADVDRARLVYFGESLGAAVAVALAVEQPPAALVLRSPFTSLADMARLQFPFLPTFLLRDRFESLNQISRVDCPVLVITGDRDSVVPPAQSRRLYEAAPEPKRFVLITGADHNDYELLAGQQLTTEVTQFLDQVLPPAWKRS